MAIKIFYSIMTGQQTYRTKLDGTSPTLITDDGAFAGYHELGCRYLIMNPLFTAVSPMIWMTSGTEIIMAILC